MNGKEACWNKYGTCQHRHVPALAEQKFPGNVTVIPGKSKWTCFSYSSIITLILLSGLSANDAMRAPICTRANSICKCRAKHCESGKYAYFRFTPFKLLIFYHYIVMQRTNGVPWNILKTQANLQWIVTLMYNFLKLMDFSIQRKLVKYNLNKMLLNNKLSQLLEVNFLSSKDVETSHVIVNRMV